MSVWYQETPNGAVGCWITKRSKPVFGGMPVSVTFIVSLRFPAVIVACPPAFGRQALIAADDGTRLKENESATCGAADAPGIAAKAAVKPMAAAAALMRVVRIEILRIAMPS